MEVSNWKSIGRGCLKGSFDVTMPAYGLTICECKVFEKEGRKWVSFPCRMYETKTGEKKHQDYVTLTKDRKPEFEKECIKLLFPLMQTAPSPAMNTFGIPF